MSLGAQRGRALAALRGAPLAAPRPLPSGTPVTPDVRPVGPGPTERGGQGALFEEAPKRAGLEHFLGTCSACGTTVRVGAVATGRRAWEVIEGPPALYKTFKSDGGSLVVQCPRCHAPGLRLDRIEGTESDHACNAACMFARGPLCECQCGGANHGAGFAMMLEQLGLLDAMREQPHE